MAASFEQLLAPGVSASVGLGGRNATAEDFGAGVARARAAGAADAASKVSGALAVAAVKFQRDQDALDGFNLQKSFSDFQSAENGKLEDAKRGMQDGAKDFTKNYLKGPDVDPDAQPAAPVDTFDARSKKWLDDNLGNAGEKDRAEWEARMAAFRKNVAGAALSSELSARDTYYRTEVGKQLDKMRTAIDQQPGSVDAFKAQGDTIINASGLSEQDKAAQRDWWKNNASLAYAIAKTRENPEAVATGLGSASAGYYGRLRKQENASGDPNAGPSTSTARGFYQWTDGTWKDVVNSPEGKAAGLTMDGRGNAAQEEKAIRIFTAQNADKLQKGGFEASEKNLYMAHFLGAQGAVDFMNAMKKDPGKRADEVAPAAAAANPTVFYVDGNRLQPRTAAQVYALQTQKFTGAAVAIKEDPRFADMTYAQRSQIRDLAEREAQQQANAADTARTAAYQTWFNDMQMKAHDGIVGQADINNARATGQLTSYSDVSKLESIVAARQNTQDTLGKFSARIGDPSATWNPFDKDHKDQVNEGVKALGNTPAAAFQVYEKTGIVPEVAGVAMRGGLASNDPAKVQEAANLASNMLTRNPNAFAGVTGGKELEEAGTAFNHYVNDLGMNAQEAARRIAETNTPEFKRSAKVRDDDVKKFREELAKGDPQGTVQSAFSGGILSRIWNGKPALGLGADQRNAIMQDFAELASEHFGDYGDKDRAQAWATSQMKKLYGVSNGVLMKYPPERTYPDVDGKHDYVYRQAADDIKAATGAEIDPKSIYLMPIPTLTAQAFRTGQPTPYALHYVEKVNDQPMHKVIHGKAFVADPAPEQAKLSAQRKAQYEAERERRENPTIADVGLPQPGDPNPKYEPATD